VHGTDLFDVVRRARLPWRWNEEALRSLVYQLHTVGEETLHRDVIRVPAGSVGRIDGNRLELERRETLRRAFEGPPSTVEQAAGALQAVLAEVAGERPLLPLTGGLDSRTLLAALLVAGVRPVLWTIGGPEASDRRIASAVARRLGLSSTRSLRCRPKTTSSTRPGSRG
jgi:asparagine synthase (glutamine-hydrolysing)